MVINIFENFGATMVHIAAPINCCNNNTSYLKILSVKTSVGRVTKSDVNMV
jgi:hypothetical protein